MGGSAPQLSVLYPPVCLRGRIKRRVEGSPRFVGLVNGKECYMEKM
jgi:hypothetical protein